MKLSFYKIKNKQQKTIMCSADAWRPEEPDPPGAGVTGHCEPPSVGSEQDSSPDKSSGLFKLGPSFQPLQETSF